MEKRKKVNVVISIICILLALLCLVYGLVVRSIQSGSNFYFVWLAGTVFFIVIGCISWFELWKHIPLPVRIFCIAVLSIGIVLLAVFEILVLGHMKDKGEEDLDYIIVLGAQVKDNGPSIVLRKRLDTAYDYLIQNPDTICIVTGGKGSNESKTEGEVMKTYLVEKGIPEERIIAETMATSTIENIRYSLEYMKDGASIGVVTSNFHMFRALQIAKGEGLTNICGISAPSMAFYLPNNMFREFFGEVKYIMTRMKEK